MHEVGIARDICATVAREAGGARVESFEVEVGVLAGVSIEALEFCIGEVAREMGLGEPKVTIKSAPALIKCACGKEYATDDILEPCPACGGYQRTIVSGMDITVGKIVLEDTK